MSETEVLNGLQIRRREMENELASLAQTEKYLKNDLKTLEEKIIGQLEKEIKAKKLVLSGLESRKSELEKKLGELQGNPVDAQATDPETGEPVQQNSNEENDTELTVIECQPEQSEVQSTKEDAKHNLVF